MCKNGNGEAFEIMWRGKASALDESQSLSGAIKHERSTRRNTERELLGISCLLHNLEHVVDERLVDANLLYLVLHFHNVTAAQHRSHFVEARSAGLGAQNFPLALSRRIGHLHAQ